MYRWEGKFNLKKLEWLKKEEEEWIKSEWNNGIGNRLYFVGFRNKRGNDKKGKKGELVLRS